jgi:acetolactate synthase-1/2/3 large subunit
MTVADAIIELLARAEIDTVFGVPGGACSALDDALARARDVRFVVCQNETTATYAAAGWHRATGRPGVVIVTSGPGALNTCAPLAAARLDHDGVVVIAGDVSRRDRGRGTLQDGGQAGLDLASVMRPLAGVAVRIEHPHHAVAATWDALQRARGRHALPSFVEIPVDIQRSPRVPVALFDAVDDRVAAIVPEQLTALVAAIDRGARPTLFVGRGVARACAGAQVARLAERLCAPVLVDAEGRGALSSDHPWHVGTYGVGDSGRGDAWVRAHRPDPLITIGARLDDTTTAGYATDLLGGRVIQIDEDRTHLGRATPIELGVAGDLVPLLTALTTAVRPRSGQPPLRSVTTTPPLGAAPFHPCAAAAALQRAFAPDTVFASDIGNHMLAALQSMTFDGATRLHFSPGLGGMGSGIGLALGLALGRGRPVVCICGDGGLAMYGNELLTAVAHRAPLVLAVFQDRQLGMVRHGNERVFGSSDRYAIDGFDIAAWARALGAHGEVADDETRLAALAAAKLDLPRVIALPIDPEARVRNPREHSFNFSAQVDAAS